MATDSATKTSVHGARAGSLSLLFFFAFFVCDEGTVSSVNSINFFPVDIPHPLSVYAEHAGEKTVEWEEEAEMQMACLRQPTIMKFE